LHDPLHLTIFVYGKLICNSPEPSPQTALTRVIRELSFRVPRIIGPETVQLSPDGPRKVISVFAVLAEIPGGRLHSRVEIDNEIAPRILVAALAGNDQAKIIRVQGIDEIYDFRMSGVRIVPQKILLYTCGDPIYNVVGGQSTGILSPQKELCGAFLDRG